MPCTGLEHETAMLQPAENERSRHIARVREIKFKQNLGGETLEGEEIFTDPFTGSRSAISEIDVTWSDLMCTCGQSDIGCDFSPNPSAFLVYIIPTLLHIGSCVVWGMDNGLVAAQFHRHTVSLPP